MEIDPEQIERIGPVSAAVAFAKKNVTRFTNYTLFSMSNLTIAEKPTVCDCMDVFEIKTQKNPENQLAVWLGDNPKGFFECADTLIAFDAQKRPFRIPENTLPHFLENIDLHHDATACAHKHVIKGTLERNGYRVFQLGAFKTIAGTKEDLLVIYAHIPSLTTAPFKALVLFARGNNIKTIRFINYKGEPCRHDYTVSRAPENGTNADWNKAIFKVQCPHC